MYRVPPDRAWRPAVGAQLERGVRQRCLLSVERGALHSLQFFVERHSRLPLRAACCQGGSGIGLRANRHVMNALCLTRSFRVVVSGAVERFKSVLRPVVFGRDATGSTKSLFEVRS